MADLETLYVKIERSQLNDDPNEKNHTSYLMSVWRGNDVSNAWKISRRYREFENLHARAVEWLSWVDVPFPPKSIFGNMDLQKIEERRKVLQSFLDVLQEYPSVMWQPEVLDFLGAPNNCLEFVESLLKIDAPMYFRSEPSIRTHILLPRPGSRNKRSYFKVDGGSFLSLTQKDDACILPDETIKVVLALLPELKHPFIALVEKTDYYREKSLACITQHFEQRGSLKDLLWQSSPSDSYMKKYLNKKGPKALEVLTVRLYARQILEALNFLHKKGFPYGHLHTGNVLVDNRKCRLTNLENCLLGVPPFRRYRLLAWKRCTTVFEADVVGFGAVLYELATGVELTEAGLPTKWPDNVSERIKELLVTIFSKDQKLPTVAELLEVPYFASVEMEPIAGEFKRTTKIKEILDAVAGEYKAMLTRRSTHLRATSPEPPRKLSGQAAASVAPRSRQSINTRLSAVITDPNGPASASPSVTTPISATTPSTSRPMSTSGIPSSTPTPTATTAPSAASIKESRRASAAPSIASVADIRRASASPSVAVNKTVSAPAAPPPPPSAPPAPRAPAAPPGPSPVAASSPTTPPPPSGDRSNLLASIQGFKGGLKKVKTVDKSKPKI